MTTPTGDLTERRLKKLVDDAALEECGTDYQRGIARGKASAAQEIERLTALLGECEEWFVNNSPYLKPSHWVGVQGMEQATALLTKLRDSRLGAEGVK